MATIKKELFPGNHEIFSWIKDLTQWGHRKTGTPEGRRSAEYIAGKLKEFGLEDVKIEETPSMCMDMEAYSLNIEGRDIECYYANATNRKGESGVFEIGMNGETQEFVYAGSGSEEEFESLDVKGKIVVCDIFFSSAAAKDMAQMLGDVEIYDPENKLAKPLKKYNVFSPYNWPFNYYRALSKGAAGFVGILENYYDDPYWHSEDYADIGNPAGVEYMELPAMWISRSSGRQLKKAFEEKTVLKGNMKMRTVYEYENALNVSGKLTGQSEDIILAHSHHDAVFEGAVQDGSGISQMLALAKYFAKLPKEERRKTMMFAATDTHYTDYEGHQAFIRRRKELGENLILDIAMEHIGKETYFDDDYNELETGDVEPRLVYISEKPELMQITKAAFAKYGLDQTLFYPVETQEPSEEDDEYEFDEDEVISDAYYFNENGIPIVSMVGAVMYIYHPSDKPDRIPVDRLDDFAMAFAEIALDAAEVL